jgi:hypothetical protein
MKINIYIREATKNSEWGGAVARTFGHCCLTRQKIETLKGAGADVYVLLHFGFGN